SSDVCSSDLTAFTDVPSTSASRFSRSITDSGTLRKYKVFMLHNASKLLAVVGGGDRCERAREAPWRLLREKGIGPRAVRGQVRGGVEDPRSDVPVQPGELVLGEVRGPTGKPHRLIHDRLRGLRGVNLHRREPGEPEAAVVGAFFDVAGDRLEVEHCVVELHRSCRDLPTYVGVLHVSSSLGGFGGAAANGLDREIEGAAGDPEIHSGNEHLEVREDPEDERVRIGPGRKPGKNTLGGCGGAVENRRVRLGGAHAQGVPVVLDLEAAAVAGEDRVDAAGVARVGVVEPEGAQAGPARTVGGEDLHAVEGVAALAV